MLHRHFLFLILLVPLASLCAQELPDKAEFELAGRRVWKSTSGTLLDARLISVDDAGLATFERFDKVVIKVPLSSIALTDRRYIEALLKSQKETEFSSIRAQLKLPETAPPKRLQLKVPLVKQIGAYCVPASASMIAGFHGIRIDQRQLAKFSSAGSERGYGTYAQDMAEAMDNLGFLYEHRSWWGREIKPADYDTEVLDFVRRSIAAFGPVYTSFRPGVFGDSGHGCVITGYDQANEIMYFNNPWGVQFRLREKEFMQQAYQVVAFQLPPPPSGDPRVRAGKIMAALPRLPATVFDAVKKLQDAGEGAGLKKATRGDRADDRQETRRWALMYGQRFVTANLRRSEVLLLPSTNESGAIDGWLCVYRDPEKYGARLAVRRLTFTGWQAEEGVWLGEILPTWTTKMATMPSAIWDLPLIVFESTAKPAGETDSIDVANTTPAKK